MALFIRNRTILTTPLARLAVRLGSTQSHSVDTEDVRRHERLASDWWNPQGPMRALHSMNRIRVPFIRDGLIGTQRVATEAIRTPAPLRGINVLEVGCGAGILTEALARIHANVTAIDPGVAVIDVAQKHILQFEPEFRERIDYRTETVEDHLASPDNHCKYDAVVVSEVLEHVVDQPAFLASCLSTLKPGGSIFITTFNKTCLSWFGGIIVAEYLTNLVPKGTHDWDQFIPPIETERILNEHNCSTVLINGIMYEFWQDKWKWINSHDVSYALHAVKLQ